MFEDDAILPDDFEATPQAEETQEPTLEETNETPVESEWDTNPFEETSEPETDIGDTPQVSEPQKIKIKFNHEEKEIPLDEAVPLVQKGMNYDKLQEQLQQLQTDPRLSFVEELAQAQGMDVNEYLEAVKNAREQQRIDELVQQNIPEEYAKEMIETRKFREQMEAERKTKEEEAKTNADFQEFFGYFKQANDRDFNAEQDKIPNEVWDQVNAGTPLKFAYMQHHNNELKSQLNTLKQNKQNEARAPIGSVTSHGSNEVAVDDDFLKGFNSI